MKPTCKSQVVIDPLLLTLHLHQRVQSLLGWVEDLFVEHVVYVLVHLAGGREEVRPLRRLVFRLKSTFSSSKPSLLWQAHFSLLLLLLLPSARQLQQQHMKKREKLGCAFEGIECFIFRSGSEAHR